MSAAPCYLSMTTVDRRDDSEWLFAACMLVLSVLILWAILGRE